MTNKLKAKLKNQGGFTLVEMLIVVAIIAILIAVSIPMINSSLEKAREAVDDANARDAISLAAVKVLTDKIDTETTWSYIVNSDQTGNLGEESDTNAYTAQSEKYIKGSKLTVTYDPTGNNNEGSFKDTFTTP